MRLIVQPIAGDFHLCARLGLIFVPPSARFALFDGCKVVHAVLDDSPSARAGIEHRDVIMSVDGQRLEAILHMVFSDRRPTEITVQTFVARYFTVANIAVRVPPEPYRSLDDIAREAADIVAARPEPDRTPYLNPRFDGIRALLAPRRGRRR